MENIHLPIIIASGCWSSTEEQINKLLETSIGAVCLKTCTLLPKVGNDEPTFYRKENITFNSKGLPNSGYLYYKDLILKYKKKPLFISIAFETNSNHYIILKDLAKLTEEKIYVEINMSCPNIINKLIPGYNIDLIKDLLNYLKINYKPNLILGLKLPPYLDIEYIQSISNIINDNLSINFITVCNAIPNTISLNFNEESNLKTVIGAMSGKSNKYISLGNVYNFHKFLNKKIKIIGCGGISSLKDIKEYKKCGADYFQIASCFYDERNNELKINKIKELIKEYLNEYPNI